MRASARVQGGPELARAFGRMAERTDQAPEVAQRAAEPIAEAARALAPSRTGALIASIDIVPTDTGATVTAGGPDVPYAGVIEYGWSARNIDAQPYLGPAASGQADAAVGAYRDWVGDLVDRFDRDAP